MSYYDDDRSRRRTTRTETRNDRRGSDDYYDETAYRNTRDNARSTALVKRRDSSSDTIEEVRRDISPGGGYYRETTIRKSGTRPVGSGARARSYDDDRYYEDDRSYTSRRGGGDSSYAAARKSRDYDDRRSRRGRDDYSDDSESRSRSRTPPKKERRKSMPEEALEALGLGGVLAALTGKKQSSSRERDGNQRAKSSKDGERSKSHGREQAIQALKAAVLSGAAEAFRARKEPGGWGGEKGKRILTAAITAGGVDGLVNMKKDPEHHKFIDTVGSALAGVATSRIVNGPRSQSRGPGRGSPDSYASGRSRRGRSGSRVGEAVAAGGLGAIASRVYDRVRSRSRGGGDRRGRSRSRDSYDSYDSRSPPRQGVRDRSRSVIARGLSKVGLDSAADRVDPNTRARSVSRGPGDRRGPRYSDDPYVQNQFQDYNVSQPPHVQSQSRSIGPGGVEVDGDGRGLQYGTSRDPGRHQDPDHPAAFSPPPGPYTLDYGPRHTGDPETDSDSDLGSSSEDEKEKKKSRRKMLITGGLATVATIHAGHSVYQSMEKREARKRQVREGKINKEEAEKNKRRDQLQEAASIGLAALGLKGAYSEWKETKESREEFAEAREKSERHAHKRAMRRRKSALLGAGQHYQDSGYSSSMPQLGHYAPSPPPATNGHHHHHSGHRDHRSNDNYYNDNISPGAGPYMSGAAGSTTQYFDDNPYGMMDNHNPQQQTAPPPQYEHHAAPQPQQAYPNPYEPHQFSAPVPGGTGFPPPPMGQPAPGGVGFPPPPVGGHTA